MLKFAIEYFMKEKKKSTNLLLTAMCSLLAIELILEMYYDPLLSPFYYEGLIGFFNSLYRMVIILLVIFAFVYLIVCSCQYYNTLHSKVLGLLKIFGYKTREIVFFFLMQIIIVLGMAFALFIILHIPVKYMVFKIIYASLNKNYVFIFHQKSFYETIAILFMFLIMIIMMEMRYVIQSHTVRLLNDQNLMTLKIYRNRVFRQLFSCLLFGYGIYVLLSEPVTIGLFVTISLCALSLSGIIKYTLSDLIEWFLKKPSVKATSLVVWKNLLFLLKAMSGIVVFMLVINIIIQFYIYVFIDVPGAYIEYMVILYLVNMIIGYLVYLRLRVYSMAQERYYNLYVLGYSRKEIKKYSCQEIVLFYLLVTVLISIYPLLMLWAINRISIFEARYMTVLLGYLLPLMVSGLLAYLHQGKVLNRL